MTIEEGGGASPSTEPAAGTSSATDISLREHIELNWRWQQRFDMERDRRYSDIAIEKEKALQIKEKADGRALELAREIQTYKDEKANELRAQIESERGEYLKRAEYNSAHLALIDKMETAIKPLNEYVVAQSGTRAITPQSAFAVLAAVGVLAGLYFGTHKNTTVVPVAPSTVTVTTTTP